MNYTPEMTQQMIEVYTKNPNRETVKKLAEEMNRSEKSIIGKLSREGVYQRQSYKTKTGEDPVTKEVLVVEIAEKLGVDLKLVAGLEKSPKATLKNILEALS